MEGAIHRAGKGGDSRAGERYLAAHERRSWAQADGGSGGVAVQVILNMDPSKSPSEIISVTPKTIEHEAD